MVISIRLSSSISSPPSNPCYVPRVPAKPAGKPLPRGLMRSPAGLPEMRLRRELALEACRPGNVALRQKGWGSLVPGNKRTLGP